MGSNEHYPTSVIVSGYTDVNDLVYCINEGLISRYVLKPWETEDIRAAVRQGKSSKNIRGFVTPPTTCRNAAG